MNLKIKCKFCKIPLDSCNYSIYVCPKCNSEFWCFLDKLKLLKKGDKSKYITNFGKKVKSKRQINIFKNFL